MHEEGVQGGERHVTHETWDELACASTWGPGVARSPSLLALLLLLFLLPLALASLRGGTALSRTAC
jgi:hypothetical protein